METLATPGVNTLIIQFTTDDKPDQFVPQVIVSDDHDKLWHHMNKMFNTRLAKFHDDGKEHSIHWTICRSTLL